MRILFDNCTPAPLRRYLDPHSVDTVAELDWEELANSALLDAADEHRYDVVVTGDKSLRHQQNMRGRRIALVVLLDNRWPNVRKETSAIRHKVVSSIPGQVILVPIPT